MTVILIRVLGGSLLLFVLYATLGIPAGNHGRGTAAPKSGEQKPRPEEADAAPSCPLTQWTTEPDRRSVDSALFARTACAGSVAANSGSPPWRVAEHEKSKVLPEFTACRFDQGGRDVVSFKNDLSAWKEVWVMENFLPR